MANLLDDYVYNWAPYFRLNGETRPDVSVTMSCPICCSELAVTKQIDDFDDFNPEPFGVLPCGHVFGYFCIEKWFKNHRSCPTCRKDMVHPSCGDQFVIRPYHGDGLFNVHTLPAPLSPDEPLSNYCYDCIERDIPPTKGSKSLLIMDNPDYVKTSAERMLETILQDFLDTPIQRTLGNKSGGTYLLQSPVCYMIDAGLVLSSRIPRPRTLEEHNIHYELLRGTVGTNWHQMSSEYVQGVLLKLRARLLEAQ